MATNNKRGRFSDRLKRMRRMRLKKQKDVLIVDNDKMYLNFKKVVAAIPGIVYDNVFDKSMVSDNTIFQDKVIVKDFVSNNDKVITSFDKRLKNKKIINNIDVSSIRKKQIIINNILDTKKTNNINDDASFEEINKLERKIINLIKKDLIKTVNELEIIESELYILSEINGDEKSLYECRRTIDEVKKILCKIDILKRKYDFLKDNYDFEYLLELDNNDLIDNIIELRNLLDNNRVKAVVHDYKLLDVYKFLYLRVDKIHEDTEKFEIEKKNMEKTLKERDINFEKLKDNVYNIDKMNDSYDNFIIKQNALLKTLDEEVSKIDSHEVLSYRLKGFEKYLFTSFKYLGLILMNPLRGVIPGIASQTLITKNVVNNLYKNLKWEENRQVVYDAIDYSSTISHAINDLEFSENAVDDTLEELIRLKMEYNNKFRKYQNDFLEYDNVIKKINDMENKILGNKIKIEIMKNRMKEKERENANKLKLVRKLNTDVK